jgi:hypothetical protein
MSEQQAINNKYYDQNRNNKEFYKNFENIYLKAEKDPDELMLNFISNPNEFIPLTVQQSEGETVERNRYLIDKAHLLDKMIAQRNLNVAQSKIITVDRQDLNDIDYSHDTNTIIYDLWDQERDVQRRTKQWKNDIAAVQEAAYVLPQRVHVVDYVVENER